MNYVFSGLSSDPLVVQFTDQTTGGVPPYSYTWAFGDGQFSNEQNPVHTFPTGGTYAVRLIAMDANGRQGETTQSVAITLSPTQTPIPSATLTETPVPPTQTPIPSATLTETPVPPSSTPLPPPLSVNYVFSGASSDPLVVQFTDQTTGGVPPYSYTWDFGDGQFSNEQNPVHTFPAGGTYPVRLVAMDANGRQGETTQSVNITVPPTATPLPPPLSVNYIFSGASNDPLAVQFTDQTSGGVPPYSYTWDFGDGQFSNEQSPVHTFPAGGTYNVRLVVTDSTGAPGETTQSVNITVPPTATPPPPPLSVNYIFIGSPSDPLAVQFTDQTSGGVPPYSYTWDFGDGQFSNEQSPVHTFPAGGAYNVRLVVTDSTGAPGETTQSVNITVPPTATPPPPPLSVNYVFSGASSDPLVVQFTDQTSGGVPPYNYTWDFGDGQFSNEQNPVHTFPAGGAYNVRLVVTDSTGAPGETMQSVNITVPPTSTPVPAPINASFITNPSADPLAIQFSDQTSGGVPPYNYTWDFGDGQISNEQNPLHTFAAGGTYPVKLTVTDSGGTLGEVSQEVVVTGPAPTPAPTPGTADSAPVFPDLGDPRISQIYQVGSSSGNLPSVFTYAGGLPLAQSEILRTFGPGQTYNLNSQPQLQAIVDWFNQAMADGSTSFSRGSLTAGADWLASDVLDPNRAGVSACTPGETPLECELRLTQPVLVFIGVGLNDAIQGVDVGAFESTLRQIVSTTAARGVVPVLLTLPRTDLVDTATAQQYNEAIFRIAQESGAPVLNIWRLLTDLPQFGISGTTLTASPTGQGDLDPGATGSFGANAVNNALLRFLSEFRTTILAGI
ncbi:MAG: PKD domain-containing protein [Chloroflexi bacterium]|nr:PKD domain-containing protein [Chloroflexota bacterium]